MRIKFICHMIILFSVMLGVALFIKTDPLSRWVIWGTFVYILSKELIDEFRVVNQPDQDAAFRQQLFDKLTKIIAQVKGIV